MVQRHSIIDDKTSLPQLRASPAAVHNRSITNWTRVKSEKFRSFKCGEIKKSIAQWDTRRRLKVVSNYLVECAQVASSDEIIFRGFISILNYSFVPWLEKNCVATYQPPRTTPARRHCTKLLRKLNCTVSILFTFPFMHVHCKLSTDSDQKASIAGVRVFVYNAQFHRLVLAVFADPGRPLAKTLLEEGNFVASLCSNLHCVDMMNAAVAFMPRIESGMHKMLRFIFWFVMLWWAWILHSCEWGWEKKDVYDVSKYFTSFVQPQPTQNLIPYF